MFDVVMFDVIASNQRNDWEELDIWVVARR